MTEIKCQQHIRSGFTHYARFRYLNEAELSRNLELFMAHDKCYCNHHSKLAHPAHTLTACFLTV